MLKKLLAKLTKRSSVAGELHLFDPKATHSVIRIDGQGRVHETRVGTTAYGKGNEPAGGHKPDTVILTEADANKRIK